MSASPISPRPPTPLTRSWRITTAARAFVVALVTGQTLSDGEVDSLGVLLLAMAILAAVMSAIEYEQDSAIDRWVPVAEGVIVAALVGTTDAPVTPLLMYLAVPAVVAGLRHGWVATFNATLATGLAIVGAYVAANALDLAAPQLRASLPWLCIGLGTGLMAAWLTRSVRSLETAQAPYAAAHRLLSQLRSVSLRLPGGFDSQAVAQRIVDSVHRESHADRIALLVRMGKRSLVLLAEAGEASSAEDEKAVARRCLAGRRPDALARRVALPLRVGDHAFGALLLIGQRPWDRGELDALQVRIDEESLQLDTALLFDEVRHLATTEERNRLAREIHDGVAQEIASLGYLVDDLTLATTDPETHRASLELRQEVTRIVSELRLSIFDLRHGVDEDAGLAGALAEYAREMGAASGLRVHLMLDEQGTALPPRVKVELLRIAQEAISNVRKHARADNLWVTLVTEGQQAVLRIEDDGVGSPTPRTHHYGLDTMRERAERINVAFEITGRTGGGTVVTVQTRTSSVEHQGAEHADPRAAHR